MDVKQSSNLDLATVAKLIGEPSRGEMLNALFYVDALPASELARRANITPQTASSHLNKLCEKGLIKVEKHGRHRYYSLANADVAHLLETLLAITMPCQLEAGEELEPIRYARTCYDHVAGRLGVALADALQEKKWIMAEDKDFVVTTKGEKALTDFGVPIEALRKKRRKFARQCLDWTERRYHISGSLGSGLTEQLFERKWIFKPKDSRVVHISNEGIKGFNDVFGVKL